MPEGRSYKRLSWAFNRYIVNRKGRLAVRKCPFCGSEISDENSNEINFLVHLGKGSLEHQRRKEWADYVQALNSR
jgi:hypothetical protein